MAAVHKDVAKEIEEAQRVVNAGKAGINAVTVMINSVIERFV